MDDTQKHIKRLHVYVLALVVGVLILLWFILSQQAPTTVQKEQVTPQKQTVAGKEAAEKGTLSLEIDQRRVVLGQAFTVNVVADSEKEDIVGFDVLFSFDKSAFSLSSVASPLKNYQVFEFQRQSHLTVTAVQAPEVNTRSIFDQTAILTISLRPTKKGNYNLFILPSKDKEKTKFINSATQPFLPKTTGAEIEVY